MKKWWKNVQEREIYIILLALIIIIIYAPIYLNGNIYMYLDIGADTYSNYWSNISFAKKLLSDFKLWSMELGLGEPTTIYISNFLLNPLYWICFLFSDENMHWGFMIGALLKCIIVGYYAYKYVAIKRINGYARIISALMIVFCGYSVSWGQHCGFATAYTFFVVMIYYFEVWIKEKKFLGFVLAEMFLAMVSPYFCYMSLLYFGTYYLFHIFHELVIVKKHVMEVLKESVQTLLIVIMGLGCSAISFLPYVINTLASPRVTGSLKPTFKLGSITEYLSIFLRLFSDTILGINGDFIGYSNFYESPFMYVGVLFVLVCPAIFFSKRFRKENWGKIAAILFVFIFVNFSTIIFNMFSTKTYRWTFVFMPVFAIACGKMLGEYYEEKFTKLFSIEAFVFAIFISKYYVWYWKTYSFDKQIFLQCIVVCALMIAYAVSFAFIKNKILLQKILLCFLTAELAFNGYCSVNNRSLISQESIDTMEYFDDSKDAVAYLKERDESFYRISKTYAQNDLNDSMFQEYNSEQIYDSTLSAETWNLMSLFDLRTKSSNLLRGFDDKQILRNICVGKYRFSKDEHNYYGYRLLNKIGEVNIYENLNSASFGILYDSYTLKSDAEQLDSLDLQALLLDSCIIEDTEVDSDLFTFDRIKEPVTIKKDVIYEISNDEAEREEFLIEFEEIHSPLGIEIFGNRANGTMGALCETGRCNRLPYSIKSDNKTYYWDMLGHNQILIYNNSGSISGIRIYELDGDYIDRKMQELKQSGVEVDTFSDTYIRASVSCDSEKLLFIPIPYNNNWRVSVDGEEAKIYKADADFMAVVVPEGESDIIISYDASTFYLSMLVTGVFLFVAIVLHIYCLRTKKEKYIERK